MQDFEILGSFYLGKRYDTSKSAPMDDLVLYDSRDLVTHAVCVGMTGSGKTGLCLSLLEEAAIDSVPVIAIDPKGDLPNLLLTFPELASDEFKPWVDPDAARQAGLSVDDFAAKQAEVWKGGLAKWGEDGKRIKKLKESADFAVYTPGSNSGIPLSILKSFDAPPAALLEDDELLRDRINTTVTGLLGLLGIEADPIKSREHILLSTIINSCWTAGKNLDLPGLIQLIQDPPFSKVGVIDLESFFPGKERFELAMQINNLLASPGFASWLEGVPLDVQNLLYNAQGKPRVSIISIAHLNDAERMFIVSVLLNQILGWVRQQSGTTSLRAILYMDEIFGFFPPVANPPSKLPLLTLLKQARAFGVGIMLASQNPVDLDYKGLSNTGTWFIGRLQTERDKARVMEGLEGAALSQGKGFDRQKMEQTIAGLGNRVFLLNNVHEDQPVVFQSRWAMSYLRGPLTRSQIKTLMDPIRDQYTGTTAIAAPTASPSAGAAGNKSGPRPVLPNDINQYFVPVRSNPPDDGCQLVYTPMAFGALDIRFQDTKNKVDQSQQTSFIAAITDDPVPVDWTNASEIGIAANDLESDPQKKALFADLPQAGGIAKNYEKWGKDLVDFIYRNRTIDLLYSDYHSIISNADESERDFRVRLNQLVRESRDQSAEELRQEYAPKFTALQDRLQRAIAAQDREAQEAQTAKMQSWLNIGSTLLGAFMGNKVVSATNIRRGAGAIGSVARANKQAGDVSRAAETVESIQQQLEDIQTDFQAALDKLKTDSDPMTEKLETLSIKPKKKDIGLKLFGLAWTPHWKDERGDLTNAWE